MRPIEDADRLPANSDQITFSQNRLCRAVGAREDQMDRFSKVRRPMASKVDIRSRIPRTGSQESAITRLPFPDRLSDLRIIGKTSRPLTGFKVRHKIGQSLLQSQSRILCETIEEKDAI